MKKLLLVICVLMLCVTFAEAGVVIGSGVSGGGGQPVSCSTGVTTTYAFPTSSYTPWQGWTAMAGDEGPVTISVMSGVLTATYPGYESNASGGMSIIRDSPCGGVLQFKYTASSASVYVNGTPTSLTNGTNLTKMGVIYPGGTVEFRFGSPSCFNMQLDDVVFTDNLTQ